MFDEWKGKRVLITGASRGIGAAVAKQLGALGAHVAVHYHSSKAPAEAVAQAVRDAGERPSSSRRTSVIPARPGGWSMMPPNAWADWMC